ncbi:hypothetical protein CDL15_Pgr023867 [Punica granatum]|nr:hypothetical protein CDL15_Pgr023867 [Punica granatum]
MGLGRRRELGHWGSSWAGSTASCAGRAGTGPNLRVRRSGSNVGSVRTVFAELDWAESARLDLRKTEKDESSP